LILVDVVAAVLCDEEACVRDEPRHVLFAARKTDSKVPDESPSIPSATRDTERLGSLATRLGSSAAG
jgi:hypothetical protein